MHHRLFFPRGRDAENHRVSDNEERFAIRYIPLQTVATLFYVVVYMSFYSQISEDLVVLGNIFGGFFLNHLTGIALYGQNSTRCWE
jgi:hypothetical protein